MQLRGKTVAAAECPSSGETVGNLHIVAAAAAATVAVAAAAAVAVAAAAVEVGSSQRSQLAETLRSRTSLSHRRWQQQLCDPLHAAP